MNGLIETRALMEPDDSPDGHEDHGFPGGAIEMKAARRSPSPVLFVHHGGNWIRGSERCLLDHLEHLDSSRYTPVVWTNCGPLAETLRGKGLDVVGDRFTVLMDSRAPRFDLRNYVRLVRRCRELLRTHNIALVHCNASEPCQWVVPAARLDDVPVVLQLHLEISLRSRCVRLTHQASFIVGVSRSAVVPFLQDGVPEARSDVVHPTIDPERLSQWPTVTRAEFGIGDTDFVFIAVGSTIAHKGFDSLLRGFTGVTGRDRRAVLLIAGDGPARRDLEVLAGELKLNDRVRFLGEFPSAPALMRDVADALVLTSRREAFGLVLVEAGFFGLPCVATRIGGVEEIVSDGDTGLVVPVDDEARLRTAMQRLMDEPELARALGSRLCRKVRSEMVAPAATRQLEAIYDRHIRASPAAIGDLSGWRWYPGYSRWGRRIVSSLGRRIALSR
jgi:L-malate glycosyltransferase